MLFGFLRLAMAPCVVAFDELVVFEHMAQGIADRNDVEQARDGAIEAADFKVGEVLRGGTLLGEVKHQRGWPTDERVAYEFKRVLVGINAEAPG